VRWRVEIAPRAQDEVLPPVQMRQLYEAVGGEACATCRWVEFPEVMVERLGAVVC